MTFWFLNVFFFQYSLKEDENDNGKNLNETNSFDGDEDDDDDDDDEESDEKGEFDLSGLSDDENDFELGKKTIYLLNQSYRAVEIEFN